MAYMCQCHLVVILWHSHHGAKFLEFPDANFGDFEGGCSEFNIHYMKQNI